MKCKGSLYVLLVFGKGKGLVVWDEVRKFGFGKEGICDGDS